MDIISLKSNFDVYFIWKSLPRSFTLFSYKNTLCASMNTWINMRTKESNGQVQKGFSFDEVNVSAEWQLTLLYPLSYCGIDMYILYVHTYKYIRPLRLPIIQNPISLLTISLLSLVCESAWYYMQNNTSFEHTAYIYIVKK